MADLLLIKLGETFLFLPMLSLVDDLIVSLRDISQLLLPTLGAVTLIFLILFIRKCIELVKEMTKRVAQLETTVKGVDQSIEKIQVPLDTVVKVSTSVDKVHDSAESAIRQASGFLSSNLENLKDYLRKDKPVEETKNDLPLEGEDENV